MTNEPIEQLAEQVRQLQEALATLTERVQNIETARTSEATKAAFDDLQIRTYDR